MRTSDLKNTHFGRVHDLYWCSETWKLLIRSTPNFPEKCTVFQIFLHIYSVHFLKILTPGHLRSGHGIRSSDPTSEKVAGRATATVVERKLCYFQGLVYLLVPTTSISRIFYIGDLRSGQFRDLPIISKWEKNHLPQNRFKSVQLIQNHS